METMGTFPDGEWESLRIMFSTKEADFAAAPFLPHSHFPNGEAQGMSCGAPPASFWPICEATNDGARLDANLLLFSHATPSDSHHFSQDCSYSSVLLPNPRYGDFYLDASNRNVITSTTTSTVMDICAAGEKDNSSFGPVFPACVPKETETAFVGEDTNNGKRGNLDDGQIAGTTALANELQLQRKSDLPEQLRGAEEKIYSDVSESPNKKPRVSGDAHKSKKNVQSRKAVKPAPNGHSEEDGNVGSDGQSSSSCRSEDDSNASREINNGGATSESKGSAALNLNGKTRASRGSARDHQSLNARKRRERINERLRILQNLVPNGTELDISTMLEKAVHYVKFLQLQIKLLSSDDLWMYAPIAYKGMDIGLQDLHQKITSLR